MQYDCLGLNPFDLSYGERWAADAALYCKGEGLGFQDLGQMEAHEDEINEICPEFLCLGESTCRWEDAKVFFSFFLSFFLSTFISRFFFPDFYMILTCCHLFYRDANLQLTNLVALIPTINLLLRLSHRVLWMSLYAL